MKQEITVDVFSPLWLEGKHRVGGNVPLFFSEKSKPNCKKRKPNKQGWGLRKEVKPDPLPGLELLLQVPHEGFPLSLLQLRTPEQVSGCFPDRGFRTLSLFSGEQIRGTFSSPGKSRLFGESTAYISIGRKVRKEAQELRGESLPCGYRGSQLHLCLREPKGDTLSPSVQ